MIYEVKRTQTIHSGLKGGLHTLFWGFPGWGITEFLHKYLICYNNFCTYKIKNSHSISFEVSLHSNPWCTQMPDEWLRSIPRSSAVWLLIIMQRPPPQIISFVWVPSLWSPRAHLFSPTRFYLWTHLLSDNLPMPSHVIWSIILITCLQSLLRFSTCLCHKSFQIILYWRCGTFISFCTTLTLFVFL